MNAEPQVQAFASDLLNIGHALVPDRAIRKCGRHDGLAVSLSETDEDVFVRFARSALGGLAIRVPKIVGTAPCKLRKPQGDELAAWTVASEVGALEAVLTLDPAGIAQFRCQVFLTPRRSLRLAAQARDLVPFGKSGDPMSTRGTIEAKQRRLNTGFCYFSLDRPELGKVLYLQDLTSLGPYFRATGTKPENAVGGDWPNLGYLMPVDPGAVLPAGKRMCLYDTHLIVRQFDEDKEAQSAWQFLDMLASLYRAIGKPPTEMRPWIERAERTLGDLEKAPKTRVRHYGQTYFHPYTNAEHPDCMVQLSLLSAVHDWSQWSGRVHPLKARIMRGLPKFVDGKLGTMRRYLPDVGDDKNANEVDSWYLYHPLLNLWNLALTGDRKARDMFLETIDYGIEAARHFAYKWPIKFDVRDFSVVTPVAPMDRRGQTDVGGIYAWVMLQAFQLTGETRFVAEAKAALNAARGMRFELNYQANLTAWGASACIRLWRITEEKTYLALSYAYLASFFHNCQIWESDLGHAAHYSNFLAVTCLQDAPYMAIYECFDSFAAFERYLDLGGPDLSASARLLVTEYCRYALSRAWSYYPDALPPEAIAEKSRNGEIDRTLSYPVEDLYPDGQPAGQVGQEIYGAGAALVFATRAFHTFDGAPFVLFCDHFLRSVTRADTNTVSARIDGDDASVARLVVHRLGRRKLPLIRLRTNNRAQCPPVEVRSDMVAFDIPAHTAFSLTWAR